MAQVDHFATALATPLEMTRDLTCRLAALSGASSDAMKATIALWDLGDRLTLAAHGIIVTEPPEIVESDAMKGLPTDFAVSDYGREIIKECAVWQGARH